MYAICLLEVVCKEYFSLTKPLLLAQKKEKNISFRYSSRRYQMLCRNESICGETICYLILNHPLFHQYL